MNIVDSGFREPNPLKNVQGCNPFPADPEYPRDFPHFQPWTLTWAFKQIFNIPWLIVFSGSSTGLLEIIILINYKPFRESYHLVAQVSDAERTIHGSHLGPHGCSGGSSLAAGCACDASGAAAVAGCARASGASTGNTGGISSRISQLQQSWEDTTHMIGDMI